MIDENRLDEMASEMRGVIYFKARPMPPLEEQAELFRLARLGLWAEKHGIPQLKEIQKNRGDEACYHSYEACSCDSNLLEKLATEALNTLTPAPQKDHTR